MSTLAYFPQIYPGELLYSVLARYHRHMGAPSPIQSNQALFGRRLVVASIDLPGNLQALADRLSPGFRLTADRMIDELTLLPYYTAYQTATVAKKAREAMKQGPTTGLLVRLGMAAFRVGRVSRLRFCLACLKESGESFGEGYWHREHQLPGVLVCAQHGRPLQESNVSTTELGRHAFVAADQRACPWSAPTLVKNPNKRMLDALQRMANAACTRLELPVANKTFSQWTRHYRRSLQAAGLANSSSRIDRRRLHDAFLSHHSLMLGRMPGCAAVKQGALDWLMAMGRKHRKAFHPLQHVLMQDFLDHQQSVCPPFGKGPWPCRNPLANHRSRRGIVSLEVHRNKGHSVGVFACQCGYVYTRSWFSSSGTLDEPRFQSYGPMLKPALQDLIDSGASLRGIARRLEIDPKTVVKLAVELSIPVPWKAPPKRADIKHVPLEALVQEGKKPRAPRSQQPAKPRTDWKSLDSDTCRKVGEVATRLRYLAPPVRITRLQIERQLSSRGWLEKRAAQLPLTVACLGKVTESVQQFQQRRADWIIRQMAHADEPLQTWRILRKAGLTARHKDMVVTRLSRHLNGRQKFAA